MESPISVCNNIVKELNASAYRQCFSTLKVFVRNDNVICLTGVVALYFHYQLVISLVKSIAKDFMLDINIKVGLA